MNAIFEKSCRARVTRPRPSRTRLAPARRRRQRRGSMYLPSRAEIEAAPPARFPSARGDSLQLYLNEIGQVKLLTPKEEVALARRIQRGDQSAREQMIKANLRLVVKIARDYEGLGLPLLDLINEGNIGLMKGVERYDLRKGAKVSTYAAWWIKQYIKLALANQSKTIRLPVHVVDKIAHLRRAEVRLRETLDRDPTDEELAHDLQISARSLGFYRRAAWTTVSLDAPVGGDESTRIADVVADPNTTAPFDRLIRETDTQLVREAMLTLTERERMILKLRFGLEDGNQRALEEIGGQFGLTRERIRQIQAQALQKLRSRMEEHDPPATDETTTLVVAT